MKAVIFKGPHEVAIEDRPVPKIQDPTDIIVKVEFTALCGSELHVYRGHQASPTGFIMGHEFTGRVHEVSVILRPPPHFLSYPLYPLPYTLHVLSLSHPLYPLSLSSFPHIPNETNDSDNNQVGSEVKTFSKNDLVVSPFTVSCGTCFYCTQGFSSRCEKCLLFGCAALDGGQAEYVRVPLADSTAVKAPEGIKENALVLMADIFPTGWFAAHNAFKQLDEGQAAQSTVVLLGLGPVGLCALVNILDYGAKNVVVVDGVDSRLELARKIGGDKVEGWNFMKDEAGLKKRVLELTEGRGADVVVEVVGLSPALKLGFDLLRPWGIISSVGVHNAEVRFCSLLLFSFVGRC